MRGLLERARGAAEARADGLRGAMMERLGRALPGVRREVEGDRIVLSGRGLLRRWIGADLRDFRDVEP